MLSRDTCLESLVVCRSGNTGEACDRERRWSLNTPCRLRPLQCGPEVDVDEATHFFQVKVCGHDRITPNAVLFSWTWRRLARGLRHADLRNFLAGANLAPTGVMGSWH